MKTFKKALSVILSVVSILSCFALAFAQEVETENLAILITADKEEYGLGDDINITVKVTNISSEPLSTVQVQTASDDLIKIKGTAADDKETLSPGESVEFSLTVRPFCGSDKLTFLEKVESFVSLLPHLKAVIFRYIAGWDFTALNNVNYDYGVTYLEKAVPVDGNDFILNVQASYCIGEKQG